MCSRAREHPKPVHLDGYSLVLRMARSGGNDRRRFGSGRHDQCHALADPAVSTQGLDFSGRGHAARVARDYAVLAEGNGGVFDRQRRGLRRSRAIH